MTSILAEGLRRLGYEVVNKSFFDTITVSVRGQAARIAAKARESKINLRVIDPDHLGISLDETTRRSNLETLWKVFSTRAAERISIDEIDPVVEECIPVSLRRESEFLTHPVFQLYHAETEMLRYLRWLAAKDIALDRAMIPLGSCTMKLNATTEMTPVTYRQFSALHPFAPLDQPRVISSCSRSWKSGCASAPDLTQSLCSPTPARKVSTPVSSLFANTTRAVVTGIVISA